MAYKDLKLDVPTAKLRAEFKPLLSTINICVELSKSLASVASRLTVELNKISLESEVLNVEFDLEGVVLKPSTCRGLRWMTALELHLTLEAELMVPGGGDANSVMGSQQFCQDELIKRITSCQSRCFCVGCGAQVFSPTSQFKRILPLPSENWADFADIWFCHNHEGHGHGSSPINGHNHHDMKKRGLIPRPDDCLVSSLYMLVRSWHVLSSSVTQVSGKLMCRRCGNFLGFVKSGDESMPQKNGLSKPSPKDTVYKIYFHGVCFREESEASPLFKNALHPGMKSNSVAKSTSEQPVEEFMCHLLKDQSHRFTSFRFIVDSTLSPLQHDEQTGVLILLWLLDQNLTVYQFSTGAPPSEISSSLSHSNKPGQPCKLMKVLYKVKFHPPPEEVRSSSDVFKVWETDNTVHGISLPYPLCKQLVALLIDSTKRLSPSQRNLNGFHVGYLRSS